MAIKVTQSKETKIEDVRKAGKKPVVKRFQMLMPKALYEQLEQMADEKQLSVVDLIRAYIKLGILVEEAEKREGAELILRSDGRERQIILTT